MTPEMATLGATKWFFSDGMRNPTETGDDQLLQVRGPSISCRDLTPEGLPAPDG
jgi:hypothetical protein